MSNNNNSNPFPLYGFGLGYPMLATGSAASQMNLPMGGGVGASTNTTRNAVPQSTGTVNDPSLTASALASRNSPLVLSSKSKSNSTGTAEAAPTSRAVPPSAIATSNMKVSTTAKDNGDPSTPRTVASLEDEEEEVMPWEEYDFIPTTASGKQKTPNMIRNELQRYIDTSGRTQKDILEEMGVNSNSFRRFMNPKTYKNSWSAIENSTYMAAGRLLARVKHEEKENKKKAKKQTAATKRKAKDDAAATPLPPAEKKVKTSGSNKSASEKRAEAEEWMRRVVETSAPGADIIYDSCPQVVKKIKDCLYKNKGVTKASFCRIALEGTNNNSLARFLAGKKQDQQGCIVYKLAYCFFEKLRIMEGKPKSKERLKNEQEQGPDGFSTKSPTGKPSYFIVPAFW